MKECAIEKADSGQRLDKYLKKYLKEATGGFIYKMLRKKNIKLNGKKADGKELLKEGDVVTLYLSDETLAKFRGRNQNKKYPVIPLEIIYEDEDVALISKPAGMLSQQADKQDVTLVEYFLGYLQAKGEWQPGQPFYTGGVQPAGPKHQWSGSGRQVPARSPENVGTFKRPFFR